MNDIHLAFSTDDNYVKYLAVAIQSLIEHSSDKNKYYIYVLNAGLLPENKNKLLLIQKDNIKINFVDISSFLQKYKNEIFYTRLHFSPAVYYRFFIPKIFSNLDKMLYCDCDVIFQHDIAELYNISLDNKFAGVVKDFVVRWENATEQNKKFPNGYYRDFLGLKNVNDYFNSGVMLCNIQYMEHCNYTEKCIATLEKIKTPRYVDQDILNIVCEGKVFFIDDKWNILNHLFDFHEGILNYLSEQEKTIYLENYRFPYILHFSSNVKPWHNPNVRNSQVFWKYARKTNFYEEIIYSNTCSNSCEKFRTDFWETLFSVKNFKMHKIITIFGIRIKLSRKTINE